MAVKGKRGPGNFAARAVAAAGLQTGRPATKTPRNMRLLGMEDAPIKDLEEAAIEHSDCLGRIRQEREELKTIDTRLATLMKKAGKKSYNHAGITLKLREGQEKVSVKVKRHNPEENEDKTGTGE